MELLLGVDTLSYHCRLAAGEVRLEEILEEVAALGADFLQLNACHVQGRSEDDLDGLVDRARGLGLLLTLAGDVVGRAARGDAPEEGAKRVAEWARLAERLGSPFVRVASGFYRNELLGDEAAVRAELDYVVETLGLAVSAGTTPAGTARAQVLLENHSDFTPEEYLEIVRRVGDEHVGVFLDLINPVSLLLEPLPVVEQLAPLATAGHAKDYRLRSNYVEDGFHRRGFEVQWCYPGEGVAPLPALVGALRDGVRASSYFLSVEGLDNRAGVADQRDRLRASLGVLRALRDAA